MLSPMPLPPGPRRPALLQTWAWIRRPCELMDSCAARFGRIFTIRFVRGRRFVLVADPDIVKEVFAAPPATFDSGNKSFEAFAGPASLFVLAGPRHGRHRRLLTPPFVGKRMRAYGGLLIDITRRALATEPAGRPFRGHELFGRVALEAIFRAVFGMEEAEKLEAIAALVARLTGPWTALLAFLPGLHVDLGPWSPWGRFLRLKRAFDDILHAEIRRARADALARRPREDILAKLVEAKVDARSETESPLGDDELRDELTTLLIAGHETTAVSLAWAARRILGDPEVEARARAEIAGATGGAPLAAEHLARLPYLEACCEETLRIQPIVPIAPRLLAAPLRVGPHDLEPGTSVAPCMYLIHRDPALYPDPLRFRPERFQDEAARPPPHRFFPFGGGFRLCIGHAFAIYEMKAILATLLAEASPALAPGAPPADAYERKGILVAPRGGPPLVLRAPSIRTPPLAAGEPHLTAKPRP